MSPDGKRLIALTFDLKTLEEYDFSGRTWRVVGRAAAMENPAWATSGPLAAKTFWLSAILEAAKRTYCAPSAKS